MNSIEYCDSYQSLNIRKGGKKSINLRCLAWLNYDPCHCTWREKWTPFNVFFSIVLVFKETYRKSFAWNLNSIGKIQLQSLFSLLPLEHPLKLLCSKKKPFLFYGALIAFLLCFTICWHFWCLFTPENPSICCFCGWLGS